MELTELFKIEKIHVTMRAVWFAHECGLDILFSPRYRKMTLEKLFAKVLGMKLTNEDMEMLLAVIPFFDKLY